MNQTYRLLIPALLLITTLVGSVYANSCPEIPPPPYIPKFPEEDIIKVEAWMEQPLNQLRLKVTFAAPTPPTGQEIVIILTIQEGSTETVDNCWIYNGPPKTTWEILGTGLSDPNTPIAVYVYLRGLSTTDRAPNSGFYRVTASSQSAPNVLLDPEPTPMGGVLVPKNSLEILTPYLALAGLIAVVSSVYVIKRRKD